MTRTNIRRLRVLAEILRDADAVPFFRRIFTMSTWGFSLGSETASTPECGTPGCSLGHYASRIDKQRAFTLPPSGKVASRTGDNPQRRAEEHFGITPTQFNMLFSSEGCGNAKRPLSASRYVDRFTNKMEKEYELA